MRQTFDVLVETVAVERLDRPDNPGVEGAPTLLQEAAVGHFMSERMFEGVLQVREETGLVQEFRGLQTPESSAELILGSLGNRLEQRNRDVLPHHRRHLEQRLVPGRQPVDAGSQHGLHRGRDVDGGQRPRHPVAAALAEQGPGLDEGPHALFQKEGVPLRPRD